MAKLPAVISRLADVPDALRSYYHATKDDKWVLQIEGALGDPQGFVRSEKLAEFRDNNRAANRRIAELEAELASKGEVMALKGHLIKAEYDGLPNATKSLYIEKDNKFVLDVEGGLREIADVHKELNALREQIKAFDGIDVEEAKTSKTRIAELETQLAAERTAKTSAQQNADAAIFRSKIADAFLPIGGRPEALDFVIAKAQQTFTLENGNLKTKEFSGARPGEKLSLTEWVAARTLDTAFAFNSSSGGGAGGSKAPSSKPSISSLSPLEFGRNLEKIASGEMSE